MFADICNLVDRDATSLVVRAGPSIVQGLLAALLAVSAVSRVHKVCSIFIELTGIQHFEGRSAAVAIADWLHAAIQQLPRGEITKLYTLLVSLLYCFKVQQCIVPYNSRHIIQPSNRSCIVVGTLSTSEETSFLAECHTLLKAIADDRNEAKEGNTPDASAVHNCIASRKLRRYMRDFAERHQLDVV